MPSIWKDALYTGTVKVPTGDPARPIRVETFGPKDLQNACRLGNEMVGSGWHVPSCWDHQDVGPELDSRKVQLSFRDKLADRARNTFGFIGGFRIKDDILEVKIDTESEEDFKQLQKVKFVSPQIYYDWIDSTGKKWPGVTISHVAATPRPIQNKQKPFNLANSVPSQMDPSSKPPLRLSYGDYDMADEKKKDDEEITEPGDDTDTDSSAADDMDSDPTDIITDPVETPVDNDPQFLAALKGLAQHGIVLPQDTNAKNFFERVNVAIIAIGGAKPAQEPDGDEPPKDPNEPMTIGGNQPTENRSQPLQMSFGKAEEKAYQRAVGLERRTILQRVNHLEKTGRITPKLAGALRNEATKLNLSFNDSGDVVENPTLIKIAAYEALEKNSAWSATSKKAASPQASVAPEPSAVASAREGQGGISDESFRSNWVM